MTVQMRRPADRACQSELCPDEPLFSWSVVTGDPDRGVCGVAFTEACAVAAVEEALAESGGVGGWVAECWLSGAALSAYGYGPQVARAVLDAATGAVVWSGGGEW